MTIYDKVNTVLLFIQKIIDWRYDELSKIFDFIHYSQKKNLIQMQTKITLLNSASLYK